MPATATKTSRMMTMPRRRSASLPCCLTDNAIRLRCLRGELLDRQVPVERRLVVPVNALLLPWQIGQRPRHLLVHADTRPGNLVARVATPLDHPGGAEMGRSEEHTSELQSLMRTSYDVFCLKKTKSIQ